MRDYKKYYIIHAKPKEVYLALTNPLSIKLWSGEEATMCTEVNSEFSLWEGSITGRNLEFVENEKIVQQWYFGEQKDVSIVTIKLHAHTRGTSLELRHANIPDEDFENIVEGWNNLYMDRLKEFFD